MPTLLERLQTLRDQSLTRMTAVLDTLAEGDGREPTDEERELLTRERRTVTDLDSQIEGERDRRIRDAQRTGELALATREGGADGSRAVPLGGAVITRSEPVYRTDRPGPRYFRDLLIAAGQASDGTAQRRRDAVERIERAQQLHSDETARFTRERHTRAGDSGPTSGGAFVPPGYRPDLFTPRPIDPPTLWNALNPYPISDANPFSIPRVAVGTVVADQAAEGDPPAEQNLTGTLLTVTPATKTGKNTWARQVIEGSNPAIDMVVADDLQRELNKELEELAAGIVFGSANSDPVSGGGEELLDQMTASAFAMAGVRKQAPTLYATGWAEAGELAAAKGADGRPLLPDLNPTNSAGESDGLEQRWKGLPVLHSGQAPALKTAVVRGGDIAMFGSPVLNFYFVEIEGPQNVVLGVWQYAAGVIRQPSGVRVIVRTAAGATAASGKGK